MTTSVIIFSVLGYRSCFCCQFLWLGLVAAALIMEFSLKENIPGLMVFITFHKVFDTLEWSFLVSCLNSFFLMFWSRLYSLFKTMYISSGINNGLTTDYFTLEKGVRQGDSLSGYLFVLEAETFAIAIHQN